MASKKVEDEVEVDRIPRADGVASVCPMLYFAKVVSLRPGGSRPWMLRTTECAGGALDGHVHSNCTYERSGHCAC